ncbi:DUF6882 domain-containing protein [Streptomyces marincola]|uniref:DUF6882 domain-containing protein n=1 Tax=Streptomyces marincola TaxID=2878388 RepID=UPI001CF54DFC|nr:DUF6882 domain-containing protein [Streptomyces marincola]UCM88495.1 hypothetical protein LC193_11335 [Streptomyces marincola]
MRFSDRLLELARPHMAWVAEQLELFDQLVPHGDARYDLERATVTRSGITLDGQVVGSFAADGTWMWGWANSFAHTPGAAYVHRLRELGRREGVPELTRRMPDLSDFPDPRLAADHLLLICMGLLEAHGAVTVVVGGGSRLFLVTDDPVVPRAAPSAGRLTRALRAGAAVLPGDPEPAVRGWFARHGAEPERDGDGRLTGVLADGARVVVELGADSVTDVAVTGGRQQQQGLASPRPQPRPRPEPAPRPDPSTQRWFPAALLPTAARSIAYSECATREALAYAREHLGFEGAVPEWDEAAGEIRFPGGGLAARPLSSYDANEDRFAWAPGTEDIRAAFRAAAELPPGVAVPELDEEQLDLEPYVAPGPVAMALSRTAATVAGHTFLWIGGRFFAVADDRLPEPGTDPDLAARDIKEGAAWLHWGTPEEARPETMRTVAEAYFQRLGLPVNHYGMPDFLSGTLGLYEVRAHFSRDGALVRTTSGMFMAPQ